LKQLQQSGAEAISFIDIGFSSSRFSSFGFFSFVLVVFDPADFDLRGGFVDAADSILRYVILEYWEI
jgi:hypothetical protein